MKDCKWLTKNYKSVVNYSAHFFFNTILIQILTRASSISAYFKGQTISIVSIRIPKLNNDFKSIIFLFDSDRLFYRYELEYFDSLCERVSCKFSILMFVLASRIFTDSKTEESRGEFISILRNSSEKLVEVNTFRNKSAVVFIVTHFDGRG